MVIEELIKRLGAKYMPEWAVHFSDLSPEDQQDMLERIPILGEKHFDWWLLGGVDRRATAWSVDKPPVKKRGTAPEALWTSDDGSTHSYCKPIPPPGTWFENYGRTPDVVGYWAETDNDGNINRKGARFDDVDGYMTWPSFRAGSFTDFLRKLFDR
jgi:hypothetical protein